MSRSSRQFQEEREEEGITREDAAYRRISTEQEDYLIGLIDKSGYRNSDQHDDLEKEILSGIDGERFEEIKNDLDANQLDPFTFLGDSSATSLKNHIKKQ